MKRPQLLGVAIAGVCGLGALFGVGGGLIVVPALVLLTGLPLPRAIAVSME